MQKTEPIAENHITITRSLFYEGMRAIGKKGYQKAIKKLVLLLLVLYLIIAVWILHSGGSLFMLAGETLTITALLLWMTVFLPRSKWKAKYKAKSQYGELIPERTVFFYENSLTVTGNSCKTADIAYSKVTGWQETKHFYILECAENIRILVGKEGFTLGSFNLVKTRFSSSKNP